jgi:GNAT superfamily N-acetyltransferase
VKQPVSLSSVIRIIVSQVEDPDLKKLFEVFDFIDAKFNIAEHFGINQYLYGVGLLVKPQYRGQGIATEMLKARFPFLNVLGLNVTSAFFSMRLMFESG